MSRLAQFLEEWLGGWPPTAARVVVPYALRDEPGWDGAVRPLIGVGDADDRWVLSVSPTTGGGLVDGVDPTAAGSAVFRWSEEVAPLDPIGRWVPADDPVLPDWLRPFGGEVLVVTDDEGYLAGVGLKQHLDSGWEIAVGTEPRGRGQGLARRLVATAGARVLDEGRVPLYVHADDNHASAAAAVAAGFPDLGWRMIEAGH